MLGLTNGKQRGVSVKYVLLIVSCHWKSIHYYMIVKGNGKGQVTHRNKRTNNLLYITNNLIPLIILTTYTNT